MLADLTPIAAARELTRDEVARAMKALLDPTVGDESKSLFLRTWARRGETNPDLPRGETASELAACAEALLPRAVHPGVCGTWRGKPLLDCCGTGGGGLNLLNISTGVVFILAAMGIPVVKHGNRGLTKKSGSADVLEALGIRIDLPPEKLESCLEEVGAAFLFAPAYHTSFSVIAPVRRRLGAEGQRTVFNLLGPLLNPARPDARLVGVFTVEHAHLYSRTLETMECPHFVVACAEASSQMKPIGEVSAHGNTMILGTRPEPDHDNRRTFTLEIPGDTMERLESLLVPGAPESADRLHALLSGREKTGLARETLLINAAVAAWAHGTCASIDEGLVQSREALESGRAGAVLKKWKEFSKRA